jgi:hypothetical protein
MKKQIATEVEKILSANKETVARRTNLLKLQQLILDLKQKGILKDNKPCFQTMDDIKSRNY